MYTPVTYMVYTILSLATTIWVARTLFSNGQIFLVEAFGGDKEMADAVNKLLAVGFYLVNIGFVAFFLSFGEKPENLVAAIEYISIKMGVVLFFLGAAHMFNVFNFGRMRRKARNSQRQAPPPRPDQMSPAPEAIATLAARMADTKE